MKKKKDIPDELEYAVDKDGVAIDNILEENLCEEEEKMSNGTMNLVILVGRVGKDPKVFEKSGGQFVILSVATDEGHKSAKTGEWVNGTQWNSVTAFGKNAKFIAEYVKKGNLVLINGKLSSYSKKKEDGSYDNNTTIRCTSIQLLGNGKKTETTVSDDKKDGGDVPF